MQSFYKSAFGIIKRVFLSIYSLIECFPILVTRVKYSRPPVIWGKTHCGVSVGPSRLRNSKIEIKTNSLITMNVSLTEEKLKKMQYYFFYLGIFRQRKEIFA